MLKNVIAGVVVVGVAVFMSFFLGPCPSGCHKSPISEAEARMVKALDIVRVQLGLGRIPLGKHACLGLLISPWVCYMDNISGPAEFHFNTRAQ